MSRNEPDKTTLTGIFNTNDVKTLIRILSFEHAKAAALDAAEKRPPSEGTLARLRLLNHVRGGLVRAGRMDVWNAAFETLA